MEITHTELLSRKTRADGVVEGKILFHGANGENIQIRCEVRKEWMREIKLVNGALAEDGLRQLRLMPEYRRTRISISEFGLPRPQLNRVITLMAEPHEIAGCQVGFAGLDKTDFNATFNKPEPPDDQSRRPPDRSPRRA